MFLPISSCIERMPNLVIWMLENAVLECEGVLPEEILDFLKNFQHLTPVLLHTKNFCLFCENAIESYFKEDYGVHFNHSIYLKSKKEFLQNCCEIINRNFPIDTTEISIQIDEWPLRCLKKLNESAFVC